MSRIREYWRLEWESMKTWNAMLLTILIAVVFTPFFAVGAALTEISAFWRIEVLPEIADDWRVWRAIGKRQRALTTPAPKEADRG